MPGPTASEITRLFLFGQTEVPSELASDRLIRSGDITTSHPVDTGWYMADGPGRFAIGPMFEIVRKFFSPESFAISPGTYTKQDLANMLGLRFFGLNLEQAFLDDGRDNYVERTYIWNNTQFKISDNARFIVEASGERYIAHFGVEPNKDEDFDFIGSGELSENANDFLQPRIDPSHIGRKVELDFTGSPPDEGAYTLTNYENDVYRSQNWDIGLTAALARLLFARDELIQQLWDDGTTKFLDADNRPIFYGTLEGNTITADSIDAPLLDPFRSNGVVLIGGAGADTLTGGGVGKDELKGGAGNDKLFGGAGDDKLFGEDGDDILDGGAGNDVFRGGPGADIFIVGEGAGSVDVILGGSGEDRHDDRLTFRASLIDEVAARAA